jgi:hypothetical protein
MIIPFGSREYFETVEKSCDLLPSSKVLVILIPLTPLKEASPRVIFKKSLWNGSDTVFLGA